MAAEASQINTKVVGRKQKKWAAETKTAKVISATEVLAPVGSIIVKCTEVTDLEEKRELGLENENGRNGAIRQRRHTLILHAERGEVADNSTNASLHTHANPRGKC